MRLAYLDNLKVLLVVGVIAVHAAIIYGVDGSFYLPGSRATPRTGDGFRLSVYRRSPGIFLANEMCISR